MLISGDEAHIKAQIEIPKRTPIQTLSDRTFVLEKLRNLLDGYVAVADCSLCHFVPELLELYPEAHVIYTVRNSDAGAKSISQLADTVQLNMLSIILFWLPCLRYIPRSRWLQTLHEGRWRELYVRPGEELEHTRRTRNRHIEWVQLSVPKGQIIFYNVKDGWKPLCNALHLPVPQHPFPKMNDSQIMDHFSKKQIARGLMRWAAVLGADVIVVAVTWQVAVSTSLS